MAAQNPWDVPGWRAIGREAALVNQLVGSGATALGQANYADRIGEYYNAFFGLSIGLERLAKLILVADFALTHDGALPQQKLVRKFGHDIASLGDAVHEVAQRHQLSLMYSRPNDIIAVKIIECLDSFAARGGRYANFAALGDPDLGQDEPINAWWNEVAETILDRHYYGQPVQYQVESNAEEIHRMMVPFTSVGFVNEGNEVMDSPLEASIRTGQVKIVQHWGRYYALTIVRWLAAVFYEITQFASLNQGMHAFFGAWEHIRYYVIPDEFLLQEKNWPLDLNADQ